MTNPTKIPGLPKPPAKIDFELKKYLETIAEIIEIRLGRKGQSIDRAVTVRELINCGVVEGVPTSQNFSVNNQSFTNIGITNPLVSTTVPPAPTGFTASGLYAQVLLSWDLPLYANHAHTEIFSHTSNSIGDATLTGVSTSSKYLDPVGGGVTRYYWIRHVSTSDVRSNFNNTAGTEGTTDTDVAVLLADLAGAITTSELATSLSEPISLITANATTTGSVAFQVAAEAVARAAEIANEATARANAIAAEATARATAISTAVSAEATARGNALTEEATARATAITSAVGVETAARVTAISNEVTARTTAITNSSNALQAQLNDLTGIAAWSNSANYIVGDKVRHSDKLWSALSSNYNSEPTSGGNPETSTNSDWSLTGNYTSLASVTADNSAAITAINNISSGSSSAAAQAINNLQSTKEDTGVAASAIAALTTTVDNTYAKSSDVTALETAVFNDMTGVADWNSSTSYVVGNRVISDKKLFRASDASTNIEPPNASYWVLDTLSSASAVTDLSTTLTTDYITSANTTLLLAQKETAGAAATALSDAQAYSDANSASASDLTALETAVFNDMTGVADWNSSTAYIVGDKVISNKKLFRAVSNSTNQIPPNTSFWALDTLSSASAVTDLSTTLTNDYATSNATNLLLAQKETAGAAAQALTDAKAYSDGNFATSSDVTALETAIFNDMTGVADWNSSTAYAVGDRVISNKKLYRASNGSTNIEPPNTSYWVEDTLSYASAVSDLSTTLTNDYTTTSNTTLLLAQKENAGAAATALSDAQAYSDANSASASDLTAVETAIFNDMTGVADWNNSTNYAIGDRVISGKKLFRANAISTNIQPPNASYWVLDTLSSASAVTDLSTTLTNDYITSANTTLLLAQKETAGAAATALSDAQTYVNDNFATSSDLTAVETAVFNDMTGVADWNSSTTYAVGDRVISGKKLFRAVSNSTNQIPPNASYWNLDTLSSASAVSDLSTTLTNDYITSANTTLLLAQKETAGAAAQALSDAQAYANNNFATSSDLTNLETATFGNLTGLSAYNVSNTYAVDDRVTHGDGANKKIYIAIAASDASNAHAPTVSSYWSEDTVASQAVTNAALGGKETAGAAAQALTSANTYTDNNAASASEFSLLDTAVFEDVVGVNAWANTTNYSVGDRVYYERKIYRVSDATNITGIAPNTAGNTNWVIDAVASASALSALDTRVTDNYALSTEVTNLLGNLNGNTVAQFTVNKIAEAAPTYATASNLNALETSIFVDLINASAWDTNINYVTGNYVFHNNKIYEALTASSGVEPGTDSIRWKQDTLTTIEQVEAAYAKSSDVTVLQSNIFNSMTGVADWSSSTSYVADDRVVHTESTGVKKLYKCLVGNSNSTPSANNTNWELDTLASALAVTALDTKVTNDYSTTSSLNGLFAAKEDAGTAAGLLGSYTTTANQTTATAAAVDAAYAAIFTEMTGVLDWNSSTTYLVNDRVIHRETAVANRKVYKALINNTNAIPSNNITGSSPKWALDTLAFAGALSTLDAIVNADGSGLVDKVEGIELDLGDVGTTSVQQQFTAQGDINSGLQSQYTVKIDNNGSVAGFGLASTTSAAGTSTSEFVVNADKFSIIPPSSGSIPVFNESNPGTFNPGDMVIRNNKIWLFIYHTSMAVPTNTAFWPDGTSLAWPNLWTEAAQVPFTVVASGETTSDGTFIPPGVYMDVARIKYASITDAKIGSLNADKINAGFINAQRIATNSIDASKLNIDGSSITSVTVNNVPTLQLGDVSANKINSGTLNANLVTIDNLYAQNITGDINDINPFSLTADVNLVNSDTIIWQGQQPAPATNSNGIAHGKKTFVSATGWGVFENDDAYKVELWMRDNASFSNQSVGTVVSVYNFNFLNTPLYNVSFSGDVSTLLPAGTVLLVNSVSIGTTYSRVYNATTDVTSVSYIPTDINNLFSVGDSVEVDFSPTYNIVAYNFFRSPFDYHACPFHVSGGLATSTTNTVDVKIVIGLYNAAYKAEPTTRPYGSWAGDAIMGLEGVVMSLR